MQMMKAVVRRVHIPDVNRHYVISFKLYRKQKQLLLPLSCQIFEQLPNVHDAHTVGCKLVDGMVEAQFLLKACMLYREPFSHLSRYT
jgi:hypothetical protein